MHQTRHVVSALLGIAFLALGLIPLLNRYGIISFTIPIGLGAGIWVLATIAGILLLIDALREQQEVRHALAFASTIVGLAVLAFGLIPLLAMVNLISFTLPPIVSFISEYLFAVAGVFLIIGAMQRL